MKVDTAAASIYSRQYEAATASATTDDLTNPYVGPRPFETAHKKLFFGRDQEADMLLSLAIAQRVVLFHAQSGAGKSSLVNAKLIPGLEEQDYFVLPRARVGLGDGAKQQGVANVFVFNALGSLAPGKIEIEALAQAPLSQYRAWLLPEQQDKPRWLIFDQFEEILSTNKDFWQQREDFFRQVTAALSQDLLLSVMFVMRADFVPGIEPYSSLLPGNLTTRLYMELPKRTAALESVQRPVEEFGWKFETDAAEELVKRLSIINATDGEKEGEYVEPVLLQVVCQQLWNKIVNTEKRIIREITLAEVKEYAQVDQALRNFYEEAVKAVANGQLNVEEQIREWFGQCLIIAPGIRGQVVRESKTSSGLETALADAFVEKHIIRREEARGGVWYELAHDRLIRPIKESNDAWLNLSENTYQRLALNWRKSDYKDELLLAAHELPPAEEWLKQHSDVASDRVREFIKASRDIETHKQGKQKLEEEKRAKEELLRRKAELEAEQEAIVKTAARKIDDLQAKAAELQAKSAELQAKAHRRKIISYITLVVAGAIAAAFFGFALRKAKEVQGLKATEEIALKYIEQGKDAQANIELARQEKQQAEEKGNKLQQQLQALSEVYNLDIDSLENLPARSEIAKNEINTIEAKYVPQKQIIPVGVPVTVADKGLTTLILGTDLIQLRQVPTRFGNADTSPQNAAPQKIVYLKRGTPEWQAQYVAYVLTRAGVQVRIIRECGSGPPERANADLPDDQRDPNLCQWDEQFWKGLSVVVGWSTMPLKNNCALSVEQIKNKNSWRACLDQSRYAAANTSP